VWKCNGTETSEEQVFCPDCFLGGGFVFGRALMVRGISPEASVEVVDCRASTIGDAYAYLKMSILKEQAPAAR
jgi:hypothetical protein